mmetsp:Transcript_2326/g.5862  ORF Transcript_2326/g.5862 Transcript_2326/m.5862 type:complete len:401 (-) Transcript_2326:592-1794(-)
MATLNSAIETLPSPFKSSCLKTSRAASLDIATPVLSSRSAHISSKSRKPLPSTSIWSNSASASTCASCSAISASAMASPGASPMGIASGGISSGSWRYCLNSSRETLPSPFVSRVLNFSSASSLDSCAPWEFRYPQSSSNSRVPLMSASMVSKTSSAWMCISSITWASLIRSSGSPMAALNSAMETSPSPLTSIEANMPSTCSLVTSYPLSSRSSQRSLRVKKPFWSWSMVSKAASASISAAICDSSAVTEPPRSPIMPGKGFRPMCSLNSSRVITPSPSMSMVAKSSLAWSRVMPLLRACRSRQTSSNSRVPEASASISSKSCSTSTCAAISSSRAACSCSSCSCWGSCWTTWTTWVGSSRIPRWCSNSARETRPSPLMSSCLKPSSNVALSMGPFLLR